MLASLQSDHYGSATVDGVALGQFQTFTGGEVSQADAVRDRPPTGNDIDQPLTGPRTISNVVMSRTWNEDRDGPLLSQMRAKVGRTDNCSVARHPLDPDGNPKGTDSTYSPCVLIRVAGPEANRNSADKATFEVEFAAGGVV